MLAGIRSGAATLSFHHQQHALKNPFWQHRFCFTPHLRQLSSNVEGDSKAPVRLSKLLSHHASNLSISRRQAERLIKEGEVTLAGHVIQAPHLLVNWKDLDTGSVVLKVQGKAVLLGNPNKSDNAKPSEPTVWAVHKLPGEVVSENDPHNRPSMINRLVRGGVGKSGKKRSHLKPIGRLDMPSEGLILVTNDGDFARQMELPVNQIHRVYRARVHGRLTSYKLDRIRQGKVRPYGPMKVSVEKTRRGTRSSTNSWVQITSTEGKNRQIRNVFEELGVTVTRLIRIAYGDYQLQNIPPGLAVELPYKPVEDQENRGPVLSGKPRSKPTAQAARPVRWIKSVQ